MKNPAVIWVGLDEGENDVKKFAQNIEASLQELELKEETRPFSAHLTLGRVRSKKNINNLTQILSTHPFSSAHSVEIDYATLYQSTLTREGSIYTPAQKFDFVK